MNKHDVKAIFVIFFMLLLISAVALLGTNVYLNILEQGKEREEVALYEGNTTILPSEQDTNNKPIIIQQGGVLNQIASEDETKGEEQEIQTNATVERQGYYYQQLDLYSKTIYDKFKDNKENLKTGTYKIEFGKEFDELLKQENGSELLQGYYQSAMETFLYDNPDVFFLDPTKMYINIQTIKKVFVTTYEVYVDCGENKNYLASGYNAKEQILNHESQIKEEVKKILETTTGKNQYQKIQIIHDYLVDNVSYEETLSKDNIYNMYGALVNKEAVCEGYAKAFKYLMDQIGIETIVVIGAATDSNGAIQNHAWNYINLNNTWYAIDVTWDDPVIIGGGKLGKKHKYKYFLKGSRTMSKDHIEQNTFVENGKVYTHPMLSPIDYE